MTSITLIKANFKISTTNTHNSEKTTNSKDDAEQKKDITQEEFEQFIIKSGAAGSFMVFRSDKKEDELGLEEL